MVNDEFTDLKNHNTISTACTLCMDHSAPCQHSKMSKFCDRINELKQAHILKPFILVTALNFFLEFNIIYVWRSYIVQVVNAFGIPLDANFTVTIFSSISLVSTCCFLFIVRVFGKRRLFLFSGTMSVLCTIALSKSLSSLNISRTVFIHTHCLALFSLIGVYGFILLPPWFVPEQFICSNYLQGINYKV